MLAFREAARECRRKKKEYVKCLENRVAVLENQNKTLIEELKTLKDLYSHKSVWLRKKIFLQTCLKIRWISFLFSGVYKLKGQTWSFLFRLLQLKDKYLMQEIWWQKEDEVENNLKEVTGTTGNKSNPPQDAASELSPIRIF